MTEIPDWYDMYKQTAEENSELKMKLFDSTNNIFDFQKIIKDTITWVESHAVLIIVVVCILQSAISVAIDILKERR